MFAARLFLVCTCCVLAAPVDAGDLLDAFRLAEQNDAKYRAATANYQATRTRVPQARAGLLPSVNATGDITRNDVETRTDLDILSRPRGRAVYDSTGYRLSLKQPVYNAVAFAALRQARAEVRRAEAEYVVARHDLIVRIAEAYFQVLAAKDSLNFAIAERQATARQLEIAEGRREVGLAAITDVHDARARYEIAKAQEIDAENRLEDKQEALRELTGSRIERLSPLGQSMPLITPDPPDVEQWVQTAAAQSFAVAVRRETLVMAREEVQRQRAGHYPTLDIVGNQTREDADASISGPGIRSDTSVVGLQLSVPLYQGGAVSARTSEAAHRYMAARAELEGQQRATERAIRTTYHGAASGAARVSALMQAVTAAGRAFDAKRQGFEAGINSNLDVLDAARELFRTRRDLAAARYEYVQNTLRLKQAVGSLSEDDLVQANAWLTPADY